MCTKGTLLFLGADFSPACINIYVAAVNIIHCSHQKSFPELQVVWRQPGLLGSACTFAPPPHETTWFEKHLSLWQTISARGRQGGREVQAPGFLLPVRRGGRLLFLPVLSRTSSVTPCTLTDNWHFKGITLDRATRTNERKRQNDLSEGWRNISIYLFFPVCAVWVPRMASWPELR